MWRSPPDVAIYLCLGHVDMRKSINSLTVLVEGQLQATAGSGDLYVFCNRARTLIKVLYWDRNGYCLWQKRIRGLRFPWPADETAMRAVGWEQLWLLLDGLPYRGRMAI